MPANRSQLFWGACAAMFVFGIVLAILGTIFGLPEMRERLHVDLVQQGDVLLAPTATSGWPARSSDSSSPPA